MDFHPNCNYIATGSSDRTVRVWDILTGNSVRMFTGHKVSFFYCSRLCICTVDAPSRSIVFWVLDPSFVLSSKFLKTLPVCFFVVLIRFALNSILVFLHIKSEDAVMNLKVTCAWPQNVWSQSTYLICIIKKLLLCF